MQSNRRKCPREGDLYETYYVEGHVFPVRYGYCTDEDRQSEPTPRANLVPVLPDFYIKPVYNGWGVPLAASAQGPCEHYKPRNPQAPEDWCRDCAYYPKHRPVIGLCDCPQRRRDFPKAKHETEETR